MRVIRNVSYKAKMIKVPPQIMTSYDRIANKRPLYTVIDQWTSTDYDVIRKNSEWEAIIHCNWPMYLHWLWRHYFKIGEVSVFQICCTITYYLESKNMINFFDLEHIFDSHGNVHIHWYVLLRCSIVSTKLE